MSPFWEVISLEQLAKFVAGGVLLAAFSLPAQAQYKADLIETTKAWGSVVADFNRDGHDDIFVTGHHSEDRIWYWSPGGYVPSNQIFDWVDRHDCDAADVNLDGRLDLYCAVGAEKGTGQGPKELWMQGADGVFTQAVDFGAEDPYGRGRWPIFLDFNHDGYPDIYLSNLSTIRDDGQININHLFLNQGGKRFVEATTLATGARGAQCVAKGDVNHDGWDDLLVCHEKGTGHIYINNRKGDFDELSSAAIKGEWTVAKLADMNGDGRDDLVLITSTGQFQIWLNTGKAPYFVRPAFTDTLPAVGRSLTVGDFNADGRPDVYVVLADAACETTLRDKAPDLVYQAKSRNGWTRTQMTQDYEGCGHLADTVDGNKVLLENGGVEYHGPNYVIGWGH